MTIFEKIKNTLNTNRSNNAFCINKTFFTYHDLNNSILKIRNQINKKLIDSEKIVGLIIHDDLETYASIIALWFEGKAYVPINEDAPFERNELILKEAGIKSIINSKNNSLFKNYTLITTSNLTEKCENDEFTVRDKTDILYILFTSGTTGTPKGVPINIENLEQFLSAFDSLNLDINKTDKCLQMSDLTFDVSIASFLIPLLKGACIYTIPKEKIKYTYIYELMEEYELTVLQLVPSVLNFLSKYFNEINLPKVKYCFLTAEALTLKLAEDWSTCIPNAKIFNLYGPTENTIWSTYYTYKKNEPNLTYNGILAIGKPLEGTLAIIIDKNNEIVPNNQKGELCLAGKQLTLGYWNNEIKNKQAFFTTKINNVPTRFYKTGDLCSMNEQEEILYSGRIDFQVKINGYRVELAEIEFHISSFLANINSVCIPFFNKSNNSEIGLIIESNFFDESKLINYLKTKLPHYMIPTKIVFIDKIPVNINGKIDRNKLQLLL